MDERDLEQRLRQRLHARFDGGRSSDSLRMAVSRSLTPDVQRTGRSSAAALRSTGRLLLATAAVLLIAAVVFVNRPSGPVGTGTETPSPSATSPTQPSETPPAVPASTVPSSPTTATVPPASTGAWAGLDVTALTGVPPGLSEVVPWASGYVGIATPTSGGATSAWTSVDGRAWTQLPTGTFGFGDPSGDTAFDGGTRCGDRVIVLTTTGSGPTVLAWSSIDGTSWTSTPAPAGVRGMRAGGGSAGAITLSETGLTVHVTSDCATWQAITLPGPTDGNVAGVAAFGGGFVAVGFSGSSGSATAEPLAWLSPDGTHWSAATVAALKGHIFTAVQAGTAGLTAESAQMAVVPGSGPFLWTSPDGRAWSPSTADPLGVIASGEGLGSMAGLIAGDGTHLLVWGGQGGTSRVEYWTSLDGSSWTKLGLTGAGATGLAADPKVFGVTLMRDGILFAGSSGSWFGTAIGR